MATAFNNPNASFTQSLYIGKDKTAEVLRRKEAAERELMAKREAKIREQSERMERVRQQKEAETRERIRRRQQRELERQKAVMDRRMVQLEKLNVKKEEILHRNYQHASRTAANQSSTKKYVFGSSTPRELNYLEKLNNHQRSGGRNGSVSRGSSPLQQQNGKNQQCSRFLVSDSAALGLASAAATGLNVKKKRAQPPMQTNQQGNRRPIETTNRRPYPQMVLSPASALHQATMTQSLYVQNTNNNIGAGAFKRVGNFGAKPSGLSKAPPRAAKQAKRENIDGKTVENVLDNRQQPKPMIRPKNAVKMETQNDQGQNDEIPSIVGMDLSPENGQPENVHNNTFIIIDQQIQQEDMDLSMPIPQTDDHDHQQKQTATGNDEQIYPTNTNKIVVFGQSPVDVLSLSFETEAQLLDATDATLIQSEQNNNSLVDESTDDSGDTTLIATQQKQIYSPKFGEATAKSLAERGVDSRSPPPKSISPTAPTQSILPTEQEEIRELRRQKLNEIMQRTRQQQIPGTENTGPTAAMPVATETFGNNNNEIGGRIGNVTNFAASVTTSAENPLMTANNNIDKRALAQELLAKRRQQKTMQEQGQKQNGDCQQQHVEREDQPDKAPVSLASELAESGFFGNNNHDDPMGMVSQHYFHIPGQTIIPQQQQHPPAFPKPLMTSSPNQSDGESEHRNNESPLLQTPPDDSHMNGQQRQQHSDIIHPPEPNLIDFR